MRVRGNRAAALESLAAETFGTFALAFVACTADVFAQSGGHAVDHVARYAAPGLTVTFPFTIRRDAQWRGLVPYTLAQLVGALLAASLVYVLHGPPRPEERRKGMGDHA